jgi:phospholipase A1
MARSLNGNPLSGRTGRPFPDLGIRRHWFLLTLLLVFSSGEPVLAAAGSEDLIDRDCILGFLETGTDTLTLGEMRTRCARTASPEGTRDRTRERIEGDRQVAGTPRALLAHKPNYILFAAYNGRGYENLLPPGTPGAVDYDDLETQFQLSFKFPLAVDLFGGKADIYGAYSNRSFWQVYLQDESAPFRETNHEPEIWMQFPNRWSFWGITNTENRVGFVHQSNGQGEPLSRSWNRIYANILLEKDDFLVQLKPWIVLDSGRSDNPDITDFMGHGELVASWNRDGHVVSTMLRNQLESGFDRGALELSWSFPLGSYPYLKGYLQYFYGYGESLIDYDRKSHRIGVGVSLTDWHETTNP